MKKYKDDKSRKVTNSKNHSLPLQGGGKGGGPDSDDLECSENDDLECGTKPMEWEVGRHYRGWFWLNDFGEIKVKAEQKGSKPGNMTELLSEKDFTICTSKNLIKVTMKFERADKKTLIENFSNLSTKIIARLMEYDLRPQKSVKGKVNN